MDRLILVTNDDGVDAPGIHFLADCVSSMGRVIVVAPETAMSGMGHAVTIRTPLRFRRVADIGTIDRYSTNGTPSDCVKIALNKIVPRKPDLIVSGVNHGSNHSINILYSGTMAAALEGAMQHIPAIGFSFNDHREDADLSGLRGYIESICQRVLNSGLPDDVCLNVNFPATSEIKGVKVCRQSVGYWDEGFEARIDVHHEPYYWLKGDFIVPDNGPDTDENSLKNGYVSIVPVSIDLTAHRQLELIKNIFNKS